jgi:hypothetical protein
MNKDQISEVIFGWGLRNDDGHNLSMDDTDDIAEDILKQSQAGDGEAVGWNHFSLDTMPPPNVPLLVKFKDVVGVYAAMFHVTPPNEDFDFWFSTVSHANANLASPDVYDATNHTCEEWSLLYTRPQPAVNRQDLIDLLIATRAQSEGVTADLIINMLGTKTEVNQQLLVALKSCEQCLTFIHGGEPLRTDIPLQLARAAIAAAQQRHGAGE